MIEEYQWFDHNFPGSLLDLLQTAYGDVYVVGSGAILQQATAQLSSMLEKYKTQNWNKHPQFGHFQNRYILECLNIRGEARLIELECNRCEEILR
ncbi:MAG: hypothetical protein WAL56_20510 [Candidatus Sulfotelmatobacter sp.]